jgi:DedD protein
MEEKNDLMKNIANDNSNNMKKYLIIAGLVFVIFVIGIVIAKFAFGTSKDNTQVILPPEPTTKTQKSDTELFNSIPVEQTDTVDNNIQPKVEKKPQTEETEQKQNIVAQPTQENVTEFKKPEPIKTVKPVKPEVKQVQSSQPTKTEVPKKVVKTVSKAKPKPVQIKKKTIHKKVLVRNYYIQVAAVTRGEPSKKFLKLIKENGFNYKISEVAIKDKKIKRVLIGPFTKIEAQKELSKVKAKITASAFIKKLK